MCPRWMSLELGSKPSLSRNFLPEARSLRNSSSEIISFTARFKMKSSSSIRAIRFT